MTARRPSRSRHLDREYRRGLPGLSWLGLALIGAAVAVLCPVVALVWALLSEGDAPFKSHVRHDTYLAFRDGRIETARGHKPETLGRLSLHQTHEAWGDFRRPSRERWRSELTRLSQGNLPDEAAGALAALREALLAGRPTPGVDVGPSMTDKPVDLSKGTVEVRHWGNTLRFGLERAAPYIGLILLLLCVLAALTARRSARIAGPARWRRGECPVCRYAIPTPVPQCPECGLALPAFVVVPEVAPEPYLEALVKGGQRL